MNCELTGTPEQPLNPPDTGTDDHPTKLFDAVMKLLDNTSMLDDYDGEVGLIVNEIHIILNDKEEDKLARISNLFYVRKSKIANEVVKWREKSKYHAELAKKALGE
jgi:hypothetical protein